ncbi:serine/threonine-protein kinase [Fadolivirus algeromassiliense]|jgi:serine/threonine protein kinase|uniref:non-specific serine/threonine protein kinase n=1 Tax=Fadolivirus FV1/VV64 TaxID=3070911 RepID=A0A7D3V5H0_9VIRU|nr:serine/threonine-protein kinase [Fadolivirus algeromassiliense]QKF93832.1 serine/threonine-protein kinase [Fadolivirus FV1/VV64]
MEKDLINKNDNKDKPNELLNDYIILEQIGSGSFGEVYLAQYKKGGYVAVKVEDRNKAQRVYNEYKIYRYLHKCDFNIGLPKIYDYLQSPYYNIMVMQLLGPNLEDLFNKYNRKFKLSTVFHLSEQLIFLLKQLHSAEYIHRDIKPNNFLIGRDKSINQIYMMDFGLSKKYIINNKHIEFKDKRSLIGTARYASINMHMGFEPSRRDDLESVGYMLIYFLKGILPWQGIKKQKGNEHIEAIGEVKICTSLDDLCKGIPECFKEYISYCRDLKFDEKPDYDYLLNLFKNGSKKLNIKPEFEWCNTNSLINK